MEGMFKKIFLFSYLILVYLLFNPMISCTGGGLTGGGPTGGASQDLVIPPPENLNQGPGGAATPGVEEGTVVIWPDVIEPDLNSAGMSCQLTEVNICASLQPNADCHTYHFKGFLKLVGLKPLNGHCDAYPYVRIINYEKKEYKDVALSPTCFFEATMEGDKSPFIRFYLTKDAHYSSPTPGEVIGCGPTCKPSSENWMWIYPFGKDRTCFFAKPFDPTPMTTQPQH